MDSKLQNFIDWNQLRDLSGGDRAFEQELLQIYLQDVLHQLQRLQQATADGKLPLVREIAHHIKGASANVGAFSISSLAATIEDAAKNSQPEVIDTPLQQLQQQLEAFERQMMS